MKIKKKKRLFKQYFMIAIFLIVGIFLSGHAKADVKVTLTVTNQQIPVANQTYTAVNLQKVFDMIEKGEISKDFTQSSSWEGLSRKLNPNQSSSSSNISLGNDLEISPGLKHSSSEATQIITILLQNGNLSFLLNLQGTATKVNGSGATQNGGVFFTNPQSSVQPFTDESGQGIANLEVGYTAIFNGNNNYLESFKITSETKKINIDLSNSYEGISFSVQNLSNKNNFNEYVVEYGQEITYTLKISASYLKEKGTSLILHPSSNLIIDKASEKYTTTNYLPTAPIAIQTILSNIPNDVSQVQAQLNSIGTKYGNKLMNGGFLSYNFELPRSDSELTLEIHAHIIPNNSVDTSIAFGPQWSILPLSIQMNAYNFPNQNFNINTTLSNDSGDYASFSSPIVTTSGINFAMMDGKTNTLAKGGKYVLGKKTGNTYSIYTKDGNFKRVDSLKNIDTTESLVLSGGNQYVIDGPTVAIKTNTSRYGFNLSSVTEANQSLIQIIGLGMGENYFLYQVTSDSGTQSNNEIHYFNVFRNEYFSTDGHLLSKTSMGHAVNQNYAVNSQINGYSAGSTEYNVLPVNGTGVGVLNVFFAIIVPLSIMIILILGILYLALKVL